ncbi:MAG: hypothetical protein ACR2N0_03715 [Rubrobacteraceae bacterium]
MPNIGEVIRNAVAFDSKNSREEMMNADSLPESVEKLFEMLHGREVDYLLVGGVAMLGYVEGRNTEDIDVILAASDLEKLPEIVVESRDSDFARGAFECLRVDMLLTDNPLFEEVGIRYATTVQFAEREIPCATTIGLLLLKLYALPSLYRQGNFARVGLYENDVATLIQAYDLDLEPILGRLSRHLGADDLAAVRDIASEILGRIERFRRGQSGGGEDRRDS